MHGPYLWHVFYGGGVRGVELPLHVEAAAVEQGEQAREEHEDAPAQLAAGRPVVQQRPQVLSFTGVIECNIHEAKAVPKTHKMPR